MPTVEQLAQLLGEQLSTYDAEERLTAVLSIVGAMVRSYTRGNGFTDGEPNEELHAVILTSAARLLTNPSQLSRSMEMGTFTTDYRGGFIGFTLPELYVLNRFRTRALG